MTGRMMLTSLFRHLRPRMGGPVVTSVNAARPAQLERLLVPERLADATVTHLQRGGQRGCEEFAFWCGYALDSRTGLITRAFHPRTKQGPAHLIIDDDPQLLAMTDEVHEQDQLVLCQIHTHPGKAFHSIADDTGAYTDEVGFLSVVVPRFAETGLCQAEIYRRADRGWVHEGRFQDANLIALFDDRLRYDGSGWHGEP